MPINALALPVGGRQIGQLLGAASGRSDRVTCVERSSDQFAAQPSRRPCDEPNLEILSILVDQRFSGDLRSSV
jgi:hypothetical protein